MKQFFTRNTWRVVGSLLLLALFSTSLKSQLSTAPVFADNMVLQRNELIRIWGEATPGEAVHITLHPQITLAFADANRKWEATLGALPAGGPYEMQLASAGESTSYENILDW